jgi:hypothetical protein
VFKELQSSKTTIAPGTMLGIGQVCIKRIFKLKQQAFIPSKLERHFSR